MLTEKYRARAALLDDYVAGLVERIRERFSPEETAEFARMLGIISNELMPPADASIIPPEGK